MILGIGVDTVDIERFVHWHSYSRKTLSKIFSPEEIKYCLNNQKKTAERFAARFAAKEAFYKALPTIHQKPFIALARFIVITKRKDLHPAISFDWKKIDYPDNPTVHISLTHSRQQATAFILISSSNFD